MLNARRPPARSRRAASGTTSSDSGADHVPHTGSPTFSWEAWSCWYSSLRESQYARLTSDEVIVREPEPDLARRRLRRVGAVHQVVGHREREVAADRPGS